MITNIVVDIECTKLDIDPWTSYQLYVDNELMIQRQTVWNPATDYVQESIIVDIEAGMHTITLRSDQAPNAFKIETITVDNTKIDGSSFLKE